ncbi:peptide chain release factor-like protein [Nannocystaceae bacterium ST9]
MLEIRPGLLIASVSGRGAEQVFARESGGHRWQRVPPNEKRGRVHTSTVTVVVLAEPSEAELEIDPRDLEEKFTRGSGAGGQHRNKTDTAVQLRHKPTGLAVRVENGRSQATNRETALRLLRARLIEAKQRAAAEQRHRERRELAGSGQRGDKVRTIALQRDQVVDHRSGRSCSAREYLRGKLRGLVDSSS